MQDERWPMKGTKLKVCRNIHPSIEVLRPHLNNTLMGSQIGFINDNKIIYVCGESLGQVIVNHIVDNDDSLNRDYKMLSLWSNKSLSTTDG
eukprot:scaffold1163_cov193-Alexandrium_tamarense.AAC.20